MRTSEQLSLIPFSHEAQPSAFARRRTGTTLVELLVVITVGAVMLGLSVTTIHLLLGAEHEASRSTRYAASLARLARAFRDDIHAAQAVELPAIDAGDAQVLVIGAGGGQQIRYELEANRAMRLEAVDDGPPQRDVFYFPPRSRLSFAHDATDGLVRLEIEMAVHGPAYAVILPPRQLVIEAAPLRLHGFEINPDRGRPLADEPPSRRSTEEDEGPGN
jgi:type II secretory pathway pseudopilin PulG